MPENRELTAYKQPRSWVRIILWGIFTLCQAFLLAGEIAEGGSWLVLRIVIVALFALTTVGEFRKRLEVDAQGITYCPGLTRTFRLTWPEAARVTHRAGSTWKAEILTFCLAQGKTLIVPSTPEVYAIAAQHANIEEE